MNPSEEKTEHLQVVFQSRSRCRRQFTMQFECGKDNAILILETSHKHNAEVISLTKYNAS